MCVVFFCFFLQAGTQKAARKFAPFRREGVQLQGFNEYSKFLLLRVKIKGKLRGARMYHNFVALESLQVGSQSQARFRGLPKLEC